MQDFSRKEIAGALSLIAAPVLVHAWVFRARLSINPNDWANFATYVAGTAGVIVGAIGLYALLHTLRLQRLQVDNIKADAQAQEFERHLEGLLSTLAGILRETDIRQVSDGRVIARGRDAFKNLFRRKLKKIYEPYRRGDHLVDERTAVRQSFDELYRRFGSDFGHYYRTLYHCVLMVDQAAHLSPRQKKKYLDLIFCRLSKFELVLFFYNGLGSIGERKFKLLIERYGLLEHVDKRLLLIDAHAGLYEPGAWLSTPE